MIKADRLNTTLEEREEVEKVTFPGSHDEKLALKKLKKLKKLQ
jgi:hypothetical protein